jgi:predicted Fe-Mo cluster-binding NifX family protein
MKVLIAVENNAGLDSILDKRFGRAGYFVIYDTDEQKILTIQENQFKNAGHGVGIQTATFVIENGCQAVIGAQPGPKAASILGQVNVKMIVDDTGTVKEVLERHKQDLTV